MPWYFPWSDSLKLKAYRYLLNRYFGFYFLDKLILDQLDINLSQGKSSIKDVNLHSENLNSILSEFSLPFEIIHGFVKTVKFTIPWSSLLSDISIIEIEDLDLYVQPEDKQKEDSNQNSFFSTMSDSLKLAEEYIRTEIDSDDTFTQQANFEGLEAFANTLDSILTRIKIVMKNINIYFIYSTNGAKNIEFKLQIANLTFFDNKLNVDEEKLTNLKESIQKSKKIINFESWILFSKLDGNINIFQENKKNIENELLKPISNTDNEDIYGLDINLKKFHPIISSKTNNQITFTINLTPTGVQNTDIAITLSPIIMLYPPSLLVKIIQFIGTIRTSDENCNLESKDMSKEKNYFNSDFNPHNDLYYFPEKKQFQDTSPNFLSEDLSFFSLSPTSPLVRGQTTFGKSIPKIYNDEHENGKFSSCPNKGTFQIHQQHTCINNIYKDAQGPSSYQEFPQKRNYDYKYSSTIPNNNNNSNGNGCFNIEISLGTLDLLLLYEDFICDRDGREIGETLCAELEHFFHVHQTMPLYETMGNRLFPESAFPRREHLRLTCNDIVIGMVKNNFPNLTTFTRITGHCSNLEVVETCYVKVNDGRHQLGTTRLIHVTPPPSPPLPLLDHDTQVTTFALKCEMTDIKSYKEAPPAAFKRSWSSTPLSSAGNEATFLQATNFRKKMIDAWIGSLKIELDLTLSDRLYLIIYFFQQHFDPCSGQHARHNMPNKGHRPFANYSLAPTFNPTSPCQNDDSKFECKMAIEELTAFVRFPHRADETSQQAPSFASNNSCSGQRVKLLKHEYLILVIKHLYSNNTLSTQLPYTEYFQNFEVSLGDLCVKLCDDRSSNIVIPLLRIESALSHPNSLQRTHTRVTIKRNRRSYNRDLQNSSLSTMYHSTSNEENLLLHCSNNYSNLRNDSCDYYNVNNKTGTLNVPKNVLGNDNDDNNNNDGGHGDEYISKRSSVDSNIINGRADDLFMNHNTDPNAGPSPFTRKRIMYENKRIVIPGNKEEMQEFTNHFQTHSELYVDIYLPRIIICLESKSLYDLLYTRILTDLILWTPSSPSFPNMGIKAQNKWPAFRHSISNQHIKGGPFGEYCYITETDHKTNERFLSISIGVGHGQVILNTLLPAHRNKLTAQHIIPDHKITPKYSQFYVEFSDCSSFLTYTYQKHDNPHELITRINRFSVYFAHDGNDMDGNSYGIFNILPDVSETCNFQPQLGINRPNEQLLSTAQPPLLCYANQPQHSLISPKGKRFGIDEITTPTTHSQNVEKIFTKVTHKVSNDSLSSHRGISSFNLNKVYIPSNNSPKDFSYSSGSNNKVTAEFLEDIEYELRDNDNFRKVGPDSLNGSKQRQRKGSSSRDGNNYENRNGVEDMLVVASLSSFNEASGIKETTLSLSFNGALLDHRLAHHNEHWYNCLYEFFCITDYNYACTPLHRIDELHMQFNECGIDYRPLFIPFKVYLDISSMCFSNLTFDMPSSSELKLLIEDSSVYLSNRNDCDYVDLSNDYVKVVTVGLFEVVIKRNYINSKQLFSSSETTQPNNDSIRHIGGLQPAQPQTEFRAVNDALIISTCFDSCMALQNVLTYYALDGDLIVDSSVPNISSSATSNTYTKDVPEDEGIYIPVLKSSKLIPSPKSTISHGSQNKRSSISPSLHPPQNDSSDLNSNEPIMARLSLLMAEAMDDDKVLGDEGVGVISNNLVQSFINTNTEKFGSNTSNVKKYKPSYAKSTKPSSSTNTTNSKSVIYKEEEEVVSGSGSKTTCHQYTSLISSASMSSTSSSMIDQNSSSTPNKCNTGSNKIRGEPKLNTSHQRKGPLMTSKPTNAKRLEYHNPDINLNTRDCKATFVTNNKKGDLDSPPTGHRSHEDYLFIENTNKTEHLINKPETKLLCKLKPQQTCPEMLDNYFALPDFAKFDQLKAPESYPTPVSKYLLNDITITWDLYGGHDFDEDWLSTRHNSGPKHLSSGSDIYLRQSPGQSNTNKLYKQHRKRRSQRNQDVLMQIHLNKIRLQHESYPPEATQVSRQVISIQEIQILDRLTSSRFNKFLYPYVSETSPRKSNFPMLLIKALHFKPDIDIQSQEECILKVSAQPIRLNMDQEALMFLRDFFQKITASQEFDETSSGSITNSPNLNFPPRKIGNSSGSSPVPSSPIMKVHNMESAKQYKYSSSLSYDKDDFADTMLTSYDRGKSLNQDTVDEQSQKSPIFFRPVIFSPEVPIKLDYHGKYFDAGQGTLIGLLMALAQLDCSEIKLKKLSVRSGILGIDKVISYALKEWVTDIKNNQLHGILSGIGPMHSFVQLAQGIKDLVYLPIEQYKKDKRIIKGLKRGAASFTSLSAVSTLELSYKFVDFLKAAAETTYFMVSPDYERIYKKQDMTTKSLRPFDIREGVASAYHLVKEGFGETAYDLIREATLEHRNKGLVGAMGSVIRNFPCTLVKPIVATAQATSTLLGGVKHQLVPEARKEAIDKWKNPRMSY